MNIGDFFQFETSLQRDRIINSTSYKEHVLCIGLLGRKPLQTLLILDDLLDLPRQAAKTGAPARCTCPCGLPGNAFTQGHMALVAWSPRRVRSPGRTAEGPGWSLQACANSRRPAGKIGIRQSATDGEYRTAGASGGRSYALGDSREPRYHLVGVHTVDVADLRLIECLDSALARERPWLSPGES